MLTRPEALAAAKVVEISGLGGACAAVRKLRGWTPGYGDIAGEIAQAIGGKVWLMPEVEIARRLRAVEEGT